MLEIPSGATRLHMIIGDPIAQVKSPAGLTKRLVAKDLNAMVLPAHVRAGDLDRAVAGLKALANLDGMVVTVPHKFAMLGHCDVASDRARLLDAVNVMRRLPDGRWEGEHYDGPGFVGGIRTGGWAPDERPALLVGAGGAGSAIGLELLEAGVPRLAVHDADAARRDALIDRLARLFPGRVSAGSDDPAGFGLVVNATPTGMRDGDPMPLRVDRLEPSTFVGDVITWPVVTPLIAAAREAGCATQIGAAMFEAQADLIAAFLMGAEAPAVH